MSAGALTVRCGTLLCAVLGVSFGASAGEAGGGRAVLTEASAWRAHLTWGPFMQQGSSGAQPAKAFNQVKSATEPPAQDWWSTCGIGAISLQGEGAVTPAVERPAGIQVWTASSLFKVSPFGNITPGRVGKGTGVYLYNFPVCWAGVGEGPGAIRLVGTRNGVFTGQVVVSSAAAIRGLKAEAGDLAKRCETVLKRRTEVYSLLWSAERYAQGDGWRWFETSGWEDLTGELFEVAGEVARAMPVGK